jgi:hypothetical protein
VNRGRIEAPPITAEHVDRARKLLQREPQWSDPLALARRCGAPKARLWRLIEILNQRGIVAMVGQGVAAVSGRVAGRTFEEFLQGGCANEDRFAAWRASADPRPAVAEWEPGA